MINRVTFPLTTAQISDFILGKEYTNFLTLQQVINELTETEMISAKTIRNRTHLSITSEGENTLHYFENRIGDAIKEDINTYLKEKEYALRNETSIIADYYKSTSGEYEAKLVAKDRGVELVSITLSVPSEEMASAICNNCQKKNQEVYQQLIRTLFE